MCCEHLSDVGDTCKGDTGVAANKAPENKDRADEKNKGSIEGYARLVRR